MAKITIKNERDLEAFIKKEATKQVNRILQSSDKFLLKQAEILQEQIENSDAFRDLQGKLIGEFGFTPEEVFDLRRILTLLVPGSHGITNIKVGTRGETMFAILEWVDFKKLKAHPFAQHDLTRFDPVSKSFKLTETVSWVDWLENGQVIRGYVFNPISTGRDPSEKFSRSGRGLMQRSRSGAFEFKPTRVFSNRSRKFKRSELKRGFGAVLRATRRRK